MSLLIYWMRINQPILLGIRLAEMLCNGSPIVCTTILVEAEGVMGVLSGDPQANYVWGRVKDVNKCLENLTITNFAALFTLHNLKHGLSETYGFTDIANGLNNSIQSNICGFRLHDLDVNIKSFIDKIIEKYSRILKPLNNSDFTDFYYVLPIRFDSRMQDGVQVVTLGFPDLPDYVLSTTLRRAGDFTQ
ncbi:hypothetical protein Pmar_PMAR020043 [Perkinsus marinus ATCC 50983]|uniref:Uncharacterized protein n=1 Tax=Perkinsus marinus (strain ATCC 50983 / TXsc) TaxID=423536 RepID=C5L0K1_PERM5|nr:hypothetical protein Pmar_PMAR020043 [Perkinsus marinus ATCC 50983]EER09749.1 hypothetical protein Pmar_PMAR020043 [Perkinsus marinus ATCC 50983]|eukprot:XP_002777954.1 hypothetical protein Pmar_PMAR020043 [Perkinsus marinus ATCC 50983]